MGDDNRLSERESWARLRFAVVGPLLAAPPESGELHTAIAILAARSWRHPVTGEAVRFGFSTIERWYSAEQIVMRSQAGNSVEGSLTIKDIAASRGTGSAHNS